MSVLRIVVQVELLQRGKSTLAALKVAPEALLHACAFLLQSKSERVRSHLTDNHDVRVDAGTPNLSKSVKFIRCYLVSLLLCQQLALYVAEIENFVVVC